MTRERIIELLETRFYDLNYYMNSGKGTKEQKFAWEYAREEVNQILNWVKQLDGVS